MDNKKILIKKCDYTEDYWLCGNSKISLYRNHPHKCVFSIYNYCGDTLCAFEGVISTGDIKNQLKRIAEMEKGFKVNVKEVVA